MIKTIKTNQENVKLTIFSSTEDSFLVTSTLVEKDGHALLINAKVTQSDASIISDYITQNNLILDKIFTLHGDPDYYFGLETIKASHPHAIAYSTKDSVEHIVHSVLGKLSVWGGILKENAPKNVVLPKIYTEKTIDFQGLTFEIIGLNEKRINIYNKDLSLLIGGIDTFNECHVFLADTKSEVEMNSWIESLKELENLNVQTVIPGHGVIGDNLNSSIFSSTIKYLEIAIKAAKESSNSAEFIQKLDASYPSDYPNRNVLELSAKVVMNEIPWG